MPPKDAKRRVSLHNTVKNIAIATKVVGKKHKEVGAEMLVDIEYLRSIHGGEADKAASEKDVVRILGLFQVAKDKKSKELLVAASEAVARICSDQALFVKLEPDVVETIAYSVSDNPEAGAKFSALAVEGLCSGALEWMECVDPVDFNEMSRLLHLSLWLGGIDEDVAVAAVDAIKRFTLHRAEHAAGMIQAGVFNVLHSMLSVHTSPEFIFEVFTLLYFLCDMPCEAVGFKLNDEIDLVTTVVECLQGAPLNMRLQVAGIRLLALWATRLRTQEEIPEAISRSGAAKVLEDAITKLEGSGFEHCATWLTTIAQRAFTRGLEIDSNAKD